MNYRLPWQRRLARSESLGLDVIIYTFLRDLFHLIKSNLLTDYNYENNSRKKTCDHGACWHLLISSFEYIYIYIYMKLHEGSFSIMHARICFFLFFHCHLLTLLKNLNGPVQFSVAIAALATGKEPIKLATWAWSPWNQLYALQSPPPLINI